MALKSLTAELAQNVSSANAEAIGQPNNEPIHVKKPSGAVTQSDAINFEKLYDSKVVANLCGVSEKSLQRWARRGFFPGVKFGRLWRFRSSAIAEYIEAQKAG